MHLDEAAESLDRPRYRLQRPLFPVLAWALHPSGGGSGLVVALGIAGAVGVLLSGIGAGALASTLGGGTWPTVLVPILPGAYAALRLTVADTLALGLVLLDLYGAERRHTKLAVVRPRRPPPHQGIRRGSHQRHRHRSELVGGAAAPDRDRRSPCQVREFTWPFNGMLSYTEQWLDGRNNLAAAMAIGSFLLAFVALWRRGPRHPLFGPLAATTAFSSLLTASVIALDFNGTRTLGPLLVLAILTLGTPTPAPTRHGHGANRSSPGVPHPGTAGSEKPQSRSRACAQDLSNANDRRVR